MIYGPVLNNQPIAPFVLVPQAPLASPPPDYPDTPTWVRISGNLEFSWLESAPSWANLNITEPDGTVVTYTGGYTGEWTDLGGGMDTVTGPGYVGIEWTNLGSIGYVGGQTGAIDDMFAWLDQAGGDELSRTCRLPLVYSASFGALLPRHLFGAEASYENNTGYCRLQTDDGIEGLSEIDLSEWTADPIGFELSFASGEDLTSVAVDTMACPYFLISPAWGESFTGLSLSWDSVYTQANIGIDIDDCGLDQSTLHSLIDDIEADTSPTSGYFYIGGTNAGIDAAHAAVLATWTSAGVTVDYNAA